MKVTEMLQALPVSVQRSMRRDDVRALTSFKPGLIVPLSYAPLLREDAIRSGRVSVSLRMSETVMPILNAVTARVYVHLVPFSAFPYFDGMDDFNKRYSGDGNFFPAPATFIAGSTSIFRALGVHNPGGGSAPTQTSMVVPVAYNTLVNFRRRVRSRHISPVGNNDKILARGFWHHPILREIVPDYEEAMLDGAVDLEILDPEMPVRGIGFENDGKSYNSGSVNVWETGRDAKVSYDDAKIPDHTRPTQRVHFRAGDDGRPDIFAEMKAAGIRVSLSNIERAKEMVAFARLREQYQGLDDDALVDLLMDGVRIPPEATKQPILLGSQTAVFSMAETYAMDGASLGDSVTRGAAAVSIPVRCPPINTGGIVLVTCEVTPEPLFERMYDPIINRTDRDADWLPQFTRDYLDPRKVEIVENKIVDVEHSSPDGLFGYRPLNSGWNRDFSRAGGKFYRPLSDTFKEDRQRFWVVESDDPQLTEDFYLVSEDLPLTPFADRSADPFEALTIQHYEIQGNTVFGRDLHEDVGAYEKTKDRADGSDDDGGVP